MELDIILDTIESDTMLSSQVTEIDKSVCWGMGEYIVTMTTKKKQISPQIKSIQGKIFIEKYTKEYKYVWVDEIKNVKKYIAPFELDKETASNIVKNQKCAACGEVLHNRISLPKEFRFCCCCSMIHFTTKDELLLFETNELIKKFFQT